MSTQIYNGAWNTTIGVPIATGGFVTTVDTNSVTVSKEEYEELKADSALLYALIDEGVEEWEGYDRAVLNI